MGAGRPSPAVVQADSDERARAAKQAMMKCFITGIIVESQRQINPWVGAWVWGITLPRRVPALGSGAAVIYADIGIMLMTIRVQR